MATYQICNNGITCYMIGKINIETVWPRVQTQKTSENSKNEIINNIIEIWLVSTIQRVNLLEYWLSIPKFTNLVKKIDVFVNIKF